MTQEKIQMFMMSNQKNFENSQIPVITEKLQQTDDDKLIMLSSANYKDPTTMLVISLFLGGLGVDRFILGDTGIGVLKLLTGGCFGILTIIDWFTIMEKTRQKNLDIFMQTLEMCDSVSQSNSSSNIEEIKKYKQLLDAGVISKEEFDAKKKELL